jgi:NAD(P)-dependent dehydrogenase (short-subunit alcohol dehydrogenase family)
MGRTGTIREVAEPVFCLESAAFVTGDILNVDGGAPGDHW